MKFRLKAFGLHLLASATVLSLTLGTLYLGWYHWPGWYLADVPRVVAVMAGVDLVLGPTLTLIIASRKKLRRVLTRDIAMIVAVQLIALIYGTTSLWQGRPLYYAFSENVLQMVQAYDLDADEVDARAPPERLSTYRIGTACRAGSGRRCPRMRMNAPRSSDPPSAAAWTSSRCRATSSAGTRGCRRFACS